MDKKLLIYFGAIIVVVILVVSLINLGTNIFETSNKDDTNISKDNIIDTGDYIPVISGYVSDEGGIISISDSSNSLYGLNIEAPEYCINEKIDFEVSYSNVTEISGLPEAASVASKMIKIKTVGSNSWDQYKCFDKAVKVTLPYESNLVSSDETVRFYTYDEENNKLSSAGFYSHDSDSHTISFYTRTFSSFIAIKLKVADADYFGKEYSIDTGFRPKEDGFYIANYGSYLESGGMCMGMVSFARYYYMNKKVTDGSGLYEKYREGEREEWRDDATAIQLATRADIAEESVWSQIDNKELDAHIPSSKDVAISWIHGMVVTGSPQLIGIYQQTNNNDWVGGHAVMTYKYSNGRFDIYDPNHPGTDPGTDVRQIPFKYGEGFTRNYSSGTVVGGGKYQYNIFLHWGYKAFHPLNAFEQLYESAEKKFEDDSIFPTIKLTDLNSNGNTPIDTDGDGIRDTPELTATITGTIKGGQQPVKSILIFISKKMFKTPVNANGGFSQVVPLYAGENDLIILGTDRNTFTNWSGYLRDKIDSSGANSSITFTLFWEQDKCDIDLHVMEPTIEGWTGRHVYPHGGQGADSGFPYMTIDNMEGFGPEQYIGTENMTLPNYKGDGKSLYGTYKFRVHYMSDYDEDYNNTQPITWRVEMNYLAFYDENNKTSYWTTNTWIGRLTEADFHFSYDFEHDGPSWGPIYEIEYNRPNPQDYGIRAPPQNELPD